MSKTVTSLIAGFMLASSITFSAFSQVNYGGHNITFRPTETMSSDEVDNTVNHFEEGKWYQLVDEDENLLVQYRYDGNYQHQGGSLGLKLVTPGSTPINYSLWSIKAVDDGRSGKNFVFVNKETNMELEYGHVKAFTQEALDNHYGYGAVSYIGGCVQNWTWYSTDKQNSDFNYAPIYSYFGEQRDSVVVLKQTSPYNEDILAVKYSKEEAGDQMNSIINDIVKVKPILAGAIKLTPRDINQMVDFQYVHQSYMGGLPAGTNLEFAASAVPTKASPFLENQFFAKEVDFPGMYDEDPLLGLEQYEIQDYVRLEVPLERDEMGGYDSYKTLYVGTEFHDNNSKELKLELIDGPLDASNMPEDIPSLTEKAWVARSFFKFTYFPSQDSLVIEPLNALSKDPASGLWKNAQYAFNSTNNDRAAIWAANGVDAPEHNDDYGQVVLRLAYLTDGTSVLTAKNTEVDGGIGLPGSLQTRFFFKNRDFNYLTRTTLKEGLYFIKGVHNGKNVVANLQGRLLFDAPEDDQNYDDMPATMWVV